MQLSAAQLHAGLVEIGPVTQCKLDVILDIAGERCRKGRDIGDFDHPLPAIHALGIELLKKSQAQLFECAACIDEGLATQGQFSTGGRELGLCNLANLNPLLDFMELLFGKPD